MRPGASSRNRATAATPVGPPARGRRSSSSNSMTANPQPSTQARPAVVPDGPELDDLEDAPSIGVEEDAVASPPDSNTGNTEVPGGMEPPLSGLEYDSAHNLFDSDADLGSPNSLFGSDANPGSARGLSASDASDASLLLMFGQAAREAQPTDGQAPIAPATVADLAVLDYMSQQLLDEVARLGRLLGDGDASPSRECEQLPPRLPPDADASFRRMERLARAHVLVRQNHFTCGLFLDGDQRPADETDDVQWAVSSQRINLATFVALVFLPHVAVTVSVDSRLQFRARRLCSLGLEGATRGLFAHVVPASRRDVDTVRLLVDMLTQQWLMAATDESHLQHMVADERGASDAAIRELLAIEPAAPNDGDGDSFDAVGVELYRAEMGRRLNRVSGSRLAVVRSQYLLRSVWTRVAQLSAECAAELALPTILSGILGSTSMAAAAGGDGGDDGDDEYGDAQVGWSGDGDYDRIGVAADAGDISELSPSAGPSAGDAHVSQVSVDGDFEVTIFKGDGSASPVTAAHAPLSSAAPGGPLADQAPERVEDFTSNGDAAPIDPSFLEERRVAVVLRDVLADPHLAALIDDIDAEPIDIGEALAPQTHVARHMQGQHVADSDAAYNDPGSDGSGDILLDELDDGFSAKPDSDEEYKGRGRYAGMTQGIIDALRAPRPGRVHYDPQQAERQPQSSGGQFGEFRGRRGIAAEDPDQLQVADSGGRVEFTPSPHPDSSRPASPQPEDSRGPKRKRLGQYQPRYADSDTEFDPKHPPGSAKKPAARGKTGRRNVRWTRQEEECFVKALVEHGPHWSLILEHHGEDGIVDSVLGSRTRGNLKDKARTIKLRLLREGRELGPFADATGSL